MTALPPDPDPRQTPGLDPGGGVEPGTTPPAAAQTSGGAEPHSPGSGRWAPSGVFTVIAVAIFVAAFLAVAVLLVLKMTGVTG